MDYDKRTSSFITNCSVRSMILQPYISLDMYHTVLVYMMNSMGGVLETENGNDI